MHRRRLIATLAAAAVPLALPALAQGDYPTRTIRLIVPFPPAGGTDVISREIAARIQAAEGWNIVAENRAGAGGVIGLDQLAKSAPDGYAIGMAQAANLAINPALRRTMPYDPLTAFAPVTTVAMQALLLVVAQASPFRDVAALVAAAKARPGVLNAGHVGNGTVGHLAGELFANVAGVELTQIPYRGAGPVLTDLLGGRVDLFFANPLAVRGQVASGELRALAVTSRGASSAFPQVPPLAASFPGFEAVNWTGLVLPAGVPAPIVARWNAAARRALTQPEMLARLEQDGSEPLGSTPAEFRAFLAEEHAKWGRIVRAARIEPS
jgi:tripartite-type tricarboxylate transporter receptor subunit TctC